MKMKLLVILSFFGTICCAYRIEEHPADCSVFEFNNLNKDTNKWKDEFPFTRVSPEFYKDNIYRIRELKSSSPDSFYRVCDLSSNNLKGYVIWI